MAAICISGPETAEICRLFFDGPPRSFETISTSRGDDDFRETIIVDGGAGGRYVLKLADNDFTFPGKIAVWRRTAEEYRKLGYYCPAIFADRTGRFPTVSYKGRRCVAYAEEYAPYIPAERRGADQAGARGSVYDAYRRDIWTMTARVAARRFDYTDYPSAYCLFETFCPSDRMDEVLENALLWKEQADALPRAFQAQARRIWRLWAENRKALEGVYRRLPTSVFQADLNATNILLDGNGRFVGVWDFNLCGRDVFLNYLFRENYHHDGFEAEVNALCGTLSISSEYYRFSDPEREAAPLLYRCLKPLWYTRVEKLKTLKNGGPALRRFLDETEEYLTKDIDFAAFMG